MSIYVLPVRQDGRYFMTSVIGSVVDQQKDVSLILDETGTVNSLIEARASI